MWGYLPQDCDGEEVTEPFVQLWSCVVWQEAMLQVFNMCSVPTSAH